MGKICGITVTYGNRGNLVEKVTESLINSEVDYIIVVDNGSSLDSKNILKKLELKYSKLHLVSLDKNYGSAGGFKAGLEFAFFNLDTEYILLLDDDNVLFDKSLTKLKEACIKHDDNSFIVALRQGRYPYSAVAEGKSIDETFASKNSFIGFDILKRIFKRSSLNQTDNNIKEVVIPYGPYGGLFFSKKLLNKIGWPKEEFVLYCDDTEFTSRVYKFGGKVVLLPGAKLEDIDKSFTQLKKSSILNLISANKNQLFFQTRNRVYYEFYNEVNNKFEYFLNMLIYSIVLIITSVLYKGQIRPAIVYLNALIAGLKGDFTQRTLFESNNN